MKFKVYIFCAFLIFFSSSVSADGINAFDGFKWGSSRNDIVQVRGDMTSNWGTSATWDAKDGEMIGGFNIKEVTYMFKEGCSELKETISEPCFLWGGRYSLKSTSLSDFDTITKLLREKYGEFKQSKKTWKNEERGTGKLLANRTSVLRAWQLSDKSAVKLEYISNDRTYNPNSRVGNKGIFGMFVAYYSSEFMENQKRKEAKKKSF